MRTPAGKREVVVSNARKVPPAATIYGGALDGALVRHSILHGDAVVLILDDGQEVRIDPLSPVAWLHPAGRKTAA
jgi:hypothetical protein